MPLLVVSVALTPLSPLPTIIYVKHPAGIATPTAPEDVFYGAKLLAALGQKAAGAGLCAAGSKLVSQGAGSSADAAAVGFGLAALKEGGCAQELAAATSKAVPVLQQAWKVRCVCNLRCMHVLRRLPVAHR